MAEMTHGNAVMKKNRQGYGYNYTDLGATYNYINNELKMEAHPVLEMWQEPLETPLGLMFGFAKTKYRNKGEKDWSEPEAPIPIIVGAEQERVGMDVSYVHDMSEVAGEGFHITNYERVPKLDASRFDAVVLDEASILKQSDGKTRKMLIDTFKDTKYRLACTATPAPNDPEELCNQAEFLGYTTRVKMLATYFVHDGNVWRLKGHAVKPMMRWMSQWAMALRKPSDIGGDDTGYDLPGLNQLVDVVAYHGSVPEGQLFAADLGGVGGRARVRKETLQDRVNRCVELVSREPDEQWIIWAGLNDEADMLNRLIADSVNVKGSMSPEDKASVELIRNLEDELNKPTLFE